MSVLCEGFADAHARPPMRGDPRMLFLLGGIAQIVLITTILAPFIRAAAPASLPAQNASYFLAGEAMCLDWIYDHCADVHPPLAAWLSFGGAMIRWSIFAVPIVLAAARCFRRIEEFTFAFGLASIVTVILSALLLATDDRMSFIPSLQAAFAVLFVWALSPVRWTRPIVVLAFVTMLASTLVDGDGDFIGIVAGAAVAVLAIGAARGLGRILARRHAGAMSPAMSGTVPAE